MRHQLQTLEGKRVKFLAEFIRYGQYNKGYYDPYDTTLLLRRVSSLEDNKIVAEHLWLNLEDNPCLYKVHLKQGDFIKFDGTVEKYQKGYKGKRIDLVINRPIRCDYHIRGISNVKKIPQTILK